MLKCLFEDGGEGSLRHVTVDTLVICQHEVLLVKRAPHLLEGGKWGVVGGFVDRDETISQAVIREVLEETGYSIKQPTLLTIRDNPDRPHEDRQNIAFVFFAQVGKKTGQPDDESTDMQWFDLDHLPAEKSFAFDHYQNLELYKAYLRASFALPKNCL